MGQLYITVCIVGIRNSNVFCVGCYSSRMYYFRFVLMRCVAIPIEETQRRALLHPTLKLFKAALRELERLDAVLATQAGLHEAAVPVGASAQLASCITTKHGCKYFSSKLKYFCARILQDIYQSWMRNRHGQSRGCVRWRGQDYWRGCAARMGSHQR